MAEKKTEKKHVINWRLWATTDQDRTRKRFEKLCTRLGTDPLTQLLPAIRQSLAENAEQMDKLHLMTTTEIQDEIEKRFGFRLERQVFYHRRKAWTLGIDYYQSTRGNKPEYIYNVKRCWPRLMKYLVKHSGDFEADIDGKLTPENMAPPHREPGSNIKETLPEKHIPETRDNFRGLGHVAS